MTQHTNSKKFYLSNNAGLKNWFNVCSSFPDARVQNETLEFPKYNATGYGSVHDIEEGLAYRVVNYVLNKDMELETTPYGQFDLSIYFYEINSREKIFFQLGDHKIESEASSYKAIAISNSNVNNKLVLKTGTEVKGITIELSEKWILKNICDINNKHIELLKQNNFLLKVLTIDFKNIMDEIFSPTINQLKIPQLHFTSRILRMLNMFLEEILKENLIDPLLSASSKDFESLLRVEKILLENFKGSFPKIEKLARIAFMSESKLKKIYKQAFGMGLYEYYQKNRMNMAKALLDSGEYSVSEVGLMIGYSNLSNFSTSFKKEFKQLPKDFKKSKMNDIDN